MRSRIGTPTSRAPHTTPMPSGIARSVRCRISSTAGSWTALTTKSTLTVATWCTAPGGPPDRDHRGDAIDRLVHRDVVDRRAEQHDGAAPRVGHRRSRCHRLIGRRREPCAPSRRIAGRTSMRSHSRTFHTTIAGAWASARHTDHGARASTSPETTCPAERAGEQPTGPAPALAAGQRHGRAGDGHATGRRGEHRQRRDDVVERAVDRGDPAASGRGPPDRTSAGT